MGGDEFVVLVEDAGRQRADAAQKSLILAGQLLAALREPYAVGEHHLQRHRPASASSSSTEPRTRSTRS